jgi:hypothetical protein
MSSRLNESAFQSNAVIPGFMPGIHPSARSSARGWVDPDDNDELRAGYRRPIEAGRELV